MANSGGKNPVNSSQFFVVLSADEKALAKLKGEIPRCSPLRLDPISLQGSTSYLDESGTEMKMGLGY